MCRKGLLKMSKNPKTSKVNSGRASLKTAPSGGWVKRDSATTTSVKEIGSPTRNEKAGALFLEGVRKISARDSAGLIKLADR